MKHVCTAVLVAAAIISSPEPARAQARSDATVPLARRLFVEGVQAARNRQWKKSHDRFSRSYELAPRLLTLFNLAAAQLNTGRLVEANESYRQFLLESSDGRYADYRADASSVLSKLESRIPYVRIRIIGVGPDDEISLDGESFPRAGLNESLPLNPGAHTLFIRRSGRKLAARKFKLREGDSKTIDLKVEAAPAVASEDPAADIDRVWSSAGGTPGDERKAEGSLLGSGWFWGAVVVVASGAAGGYLLMRDRTGEPTPGTLGRGIIEF